MENPAANEATTIYERLKSAYGLRSDEELGRRLSGISKQAIYKRKQQNRYDRDEIVRSFPDVNRQWIYSKDSDDLRSLPVRDPSLAEELPRETLHEQDTATLLHQAEAIIQILRTRLDE